MLHMRTFISNHRRLALMLVLCALLMKALIPTGYMVGSTSKTFTVQICMDGLGAPVSKQIEIPIEKGSHDPAKEFGKGDGSCSFTSLAIAGMAGADAELLALALAFILILGFAPTATLHRPENLYLRPPLRGPPTAA
jgi:hypothetical protein